MNADSKLHEMQERVREASERNARRISNRAEEVRENASTFVNNHPVATVAGGLVIGALVAVVLPRLARQKQTATPGDTRAKALKWVALAADAAVTFAQQSLDSARTAGHAGQQSLEHLGDRVTDGTAGLRKDIGRFAGEAAHNVRSASEQASQQAKSVADRIGARLRH